MFDNYDYDAYLQSQTEEDTPNNYWQNYFHDYDNYQSHFNKEINNERR